MMKSTSHSVTASIPPALVAAALDCLAFMPDGHRLEPSLLMAVTRTITTNTDDALPPKRALLVQIQSAKFSRPAEPGDRIDLEVKLLSSLETAAQVSCEAHVGEARVMRGTLTFMLRTIESERVHEQRRYLYKLWTRGLDAPPKIL